MTPGVGSIESLNQAVFGEAREEAEKVLVEARAEVDEIIKNAREQAQAERKKILEHASQEAERIRRQSSATAELWARTLQMKRREALLNNVFETARKQLHTVQEWSNYEEIARNLLMRAVDRLGVKTAKVRADQTTRKLLADGIMDEIMKEMDVELQMGEELEQGTGIIVETLDGHRRYDNTLETLLDRMKNSLRSPVYHILMGETL
jgi:vacuolar-type H+-ATPase subunit E/Vma4